MRDSLRHRRYRRRDIAAAPSHAPDRAPGPTRQRRRRIGLAPTVLIIALGLIASAVVISGPGAAAGRIWNYRGPASLTTTETPAATASAGVDVLAADTTPGTGGAAAPIPPTSAPIATVAPATPTPNPLGAECGWAAPTLRRDAANDRAAVPAYPEYAAYYELWAGRWLQIAGWIEGQCAPTWPAGQCVNARAWLNFGISTHQTTGSVVPHDAGWDALWIANYTRIERLVRQVCA